MIVFQTRIGDGDRAGLLARRAATIDRFRLEASWSLGLTPGYRAEPYLGTGDFLNEHAALDPEGRTGLPF
jgi:hypothetical protein